MTDSLLGLRNMATFNKIDVRFSCFCHIIYMNFVKTFTKYLRTAEYFDSVMTKFIVSNRTEA